MVAWTATGESPHSLLPWRTIRRRVGLPGSAAAISFGQALTAAWFFRGLAANGWLAWPEGDGEGAWARLGTFLDGGSKPSAAAGAPTSQVGRRLAAAARAARFWSRSVDVLVESRMLNEIGWMFLGAFSRMGTYAAITVERVGAGVLPGVTHKVALETFWILFVPHRAGVHRVQRADPPGVTRGTVGQRGEACAALIALSVLLGVVVVAGVFDDADDVYSDDPAVTEALSALTAPLAVALGLSAVAYGVEGTTIGCGEVGYLEDARQTLCWCSYLKAHSTFPSVAGSGLAGTLVGPRVLSGLADMSALVPPGDDAAVLGEAGGPHDGRSVGG